ncbi:MAG: response regulator transcription factor [Anaerolineaceae bacterium]|nr:response regulator transcription factor [Anaerolineaceae bacterium]
MDKVKRLVWIASIFLISLGVISLVLNVGFGLDLNFSWPLVVILLGGAFFILVEALRHKWAWVDWFYFPGCIFLALGLIFLFNVITNDWAAWAYAWLLLLTGLGAGVVLVNRTGRWPQQVTVVGIGTIITATAAFVLFGAITGGLFIQVTAPLLLVVFGVSLRWLRLETILPEQFQRRLQERRTTASGQTASSGQDVLIEPLSAREREVLTLIDQGLTNREIADRLTVAVSTVKTHINNIYGKLGVRTRIQAIKQARALGLIED